MIPHKTARDTGGVNDPAVRGRDRLAERGEGDLIYAVSLVAAIEAMNGLSLRRDGSQAARVHQAVLPLVGMARAELVDFGQRRVDRCVSVQVDAVEAGLAELEQRITAMLATSTVLRFTLRLEAARLLVRHAITAATGAAAEGHGG